MTVDLITSSANPLLKEIRRAQEQGGLTTQGWLIAEGPKLVEEAVRSRLRLACVIATEGARLPEHLHADRMIKVPDKVYRSISGTAAPQGVMALAHPPIYEADSIYNADSLVIVLDSIQDPGNAGAIVRSAEAFGASGVIFFGGSAHPMNPKTLRASAGSLFRVPYLRQWGKLEMRAMGPVFAGVAESTAPAVWDCNLAQACTIVIGNEGSGVSPGVLSHAQPIRIPTSGVESLNAAAAASVLLYEAARQRSLR